jgi:hypothetical protein
MIEHIQKTAVQAEIVSLQLNTPPAGMYRLSISVPHREKKGKGMWLLPLCWLSEGGERTSFNDSKRTVIFFIYFCSMLSNVYLSSPDLPKVHAYLV